MGLSARTQQLLLEINKENIKLGDIKRHGKTIKKDHQSALELWSTKAYYPRLLATLIFDKQHLSIQTIDQLAVDIKQHPPQERDQLADWLLANQLMKNKQLTSLITTWQDNPSSILRRLFWYHQARLRWTGQTPPDNSAQLLDALEQTMATAEPEVQWAMNFCAGQIGIHEPKFRSRCITLGKQLGLYKDQPVAKNCTPAYLPDFIKIEVAKRDRI